MVVDFAIFTGENWFTLAFVVEAFVDTIAVIFAWITFRTWAIIVVACFTIETWWAIAAKIYSFINTFSTILTRSIHRTWTLIFVAIFAGKARQTGAAVIGQFAGHHVFAGGVVHTRIIDGAWPDVFFAGFPAETGWALAKEI